MPAARRLGARPPVVDLLTAKAFLNVLHDDDDALIGGLLEAAADHVEGVARQLLGPQRWEVTFGPAAGRFAWPIAPVTAIEEVLYVGMDGVDVTLDAATYRLLDAGAGAVFAATHGTVMPSAFLDAAMVRMTVVAGLDPVPDALRIAVQMLAATWYQTREAVVVGDEPRAVPMGVASLISTYRRFA